MRILICRCRNQVKQGVFCLALLFFVSCASSSPHKNIQPQINSLVVAQRFDRAVQFLEEGVHAYGPNNELLYWLDKGLVLHLAGRYHDSVGAFENAKRFYDALYGNSLTEVVGSAAVNDYWKKYRGEDFEYVLVNVFQALNFAAMGNVEEALADMRNVDLQLQLINSRYSEKHKNVYRDDAFVRFLTGVLYEAQGDAASINDAYIANVKALRVYEEVYQKNYKLAAPQILKSNLLSTAAVMGEEDFNQYKAKMPGVDFVKIADKQDKAEVYLIEYTGFVPLKVADALLFPVDGAHLAKISFPKYNERFSEVKSSVLIAAREGVEQVVETEIGEDIGTIAQQILASRKAMMMVKAGLRPLGKYVAERVVESAVRDKGGELAGDLAVVLSNVYNFATEEADVRSWATLPNEIRIARLLLEPGRYEFYVNDLNSSKVLVERRSLGVVELKRGEKRFLISRGYR